MTARRSVSLTAGLTALLLFTTHLAASGCTQQENPARSYREQELLVKFNPDVPHEHMAEITENLGCRIIQKMGKSLYLIRIPDNETVPGMMERFSSLPEVEYAEPNYVYSIQK